MPEINPFIVGTILALSYVTPALSQATSLPDAEQELFDAKARLAEARVRVKNAKKIARMCNELAKLGGAVCGQPVASVAPAPLIPTPITPADPVTATNAVQITVAPNEKPVQLTLAVPARQNAAVASPDTGSASANNVPEANSAAMAQLAKEKEATQKFGGIELGAGLSFTLDVGKHDRVTEAEYVNNLVRIKNADNTRARLMLESHYFFKPAHDFLGLEEGMWGVGPFVAIQPGTDEIVEAIGLGLMFGFRRAKDKSESFNLGFGFVVDPNVQILGEGILPNKALPTGETTIRYKEDSQSGIMAIASFSF